MKKNEIGGECSRYGEKRLAYRNLMGRSEGQRKLGRPRSHWEDNIKMGLQEVLGGLWNVLPWIRIGTVGRLLCMRL
jgi:hypothetical protein